MIKAAAAKTLFSMKRRVYISGKITGLPIEEARANFAEIEKCYSVLGVKTFNPMSEKRLINKLGRLPWVVYIISDVCMELLCNEIHLQPNWTDSRGARIERKIAVFLKYKINENENVCNNVV